MKLEGPKGLNGSSQLNYLTNTLRFFLEYSEIREFRRQAMAPKLKVLETYGHLQIFEMAVARSQQQICCPP
jgi:hypothetical protein